MAARLARNLQSNSTYLIITRGRRRPLFTAGKDYAWYLKLLKKYAQKSQINIFSFCLLPDHVYLVVRCQEAKQLSAFMQGLGLTYALYFHRRYYTEGKVWQGRFKSTLLKNLNDIFACIRLVESMPVRLGLSVYPSDYPWSSDRGRLSSRQKYLFETFDLGSVFEMSSMPVQSLPPEMKTAGM